MLDAAKKLIDLYDAPEKATLSLAWLKLLLQEGHLDAVQKMDTLLKALLDGESSSFLRSVLLLIDLSKSPELPNGETKAGLKELVLAFVQVSTIDTKEIENIHCLKEHQEIIGRIRTALFEAMNGLAEKIQQLKIENKHFWSTFSPILDSMVEWTEELFLI